MAYSEKVLDHYNNPKNVGTLDKESKAVGTGLVGAPECGDVMRLQIEVDEESGLASYEPISTEIFDIDIHAIPARKEEPEHYHYDVRFAVRSTGGDDYVVSEESHDLSWVEIAQLAEYTQEESMLRMGRKWLK